MRKISKRCRLKKAFFSPEHTLNFIPIPCHSNFYLTSAENASYTCEAKRAHFSLYKHMPQYSHSSLGIKINIKQFFEKKNKTLGYEAKCQILSIGWAVCISHLMSSLEVWVSLSYPCLITSLYSVCQFLLPPKRSGSIFHPPCIFT